MSSVDRIVLAFPPKAGFVSLARLTVSGVASQCGFDIDVIEDLKVCVSEVLNQLIAARCVSPGTDLQVAFSLSGEALAIRIGAPGLSGGMLFSGEEDAFALAILHTLMDEVDLSGEGADAVCLIKTIGEGTL
jgi:serine/threonine-protein kinase RsbW